MTTETTTTTDVPPAHVLRVMFDNLPGASTAQDQIIRSAVPVPDQAVAADQTLLGGYLASALLCWERLFTWGSGTSDGQDAVLYCGPATDHEQVVCVEYGSTFIGVAAYHYGDTTVFRYEMDPWGVRDFNTAQERGDEFAERIARSSRAWTSHGLEKLRNDLYHVLVNGKATDGHDNVRHVIQTVAQAMRWEDMDADTLRWLHERLLERHSGENGEA